ncbi:hypothetical protein FisN_4Hu282 [Fistulifera solaris]|uniref:Uncharacterized protein n=1 Tax=Fistulifera solaris TaxID=1519565 RepID=A0A1Z5KEH9_FISSO|nr:hypothetical protein FisN_4Hu282 [Fistulifera solaris]|eukprot:GAX24724.1 hypothetical protein FisN_4Hu282 [Fistulifera solaris]
MQALFSTVLIVTILHGLPQSTAFFSSPQQGLRRPETLTWSKRKSTRDDIDPWTVITSTPVIDPRTGRLGPVFSKPSLIDTVNNIGKPPKKRLVVISPQLGDFDPWEYAELLTACLPELQKANIDLNFIAIGDIGSAKRFARVSGLPLECLRVDPKGSIHRNLFVHGGPNWDVPSFFPKSILEWFKGYVGASKDSDEHLVARAWLNYMAMCAGIAAPNTLPEILRGYIGDRSAPERLAEDEVVTMGDDMIVIRGTTDVKLGPIQYQSLWKNEKGYQRPAELATVRLRGMVETLSNFNEYVPDQTLLHLRGATFLFDEKAQVLYKHYDTGVLAYSTTMSRPLLFLEPYIGKKALNPLGFQDAAQLN